MMESKIIYNTYPARVSQEAEQLAKEGWETINMATSFDRGNCEHFSILLKRDHSNDGNT